MDMQRNISFAGNMIFLKNNAVLYMMVASLFLGIFTNSFITETVFADSDTYYVSTVGSNSYNGLYPTYQDGINGPWLTIEYAVTQITNGDTLYIREGTYLPSDTISITQKDTSSDWLTIRNYNDENVIINGTNAETASQAFCGIFSIYKSNNIHITGLAFNYSAASGIVVNRQYSGQIHQCSHIIVDNCTFSNCSSVAFMTLAGNHNITFEYNYVYKNQQNWSGLLSGQECISFQGTNHFSINNNTFINNHGINIDTKGGCTNGIICYNYINTTGGYLRQGGCDFFGGPGIMVDARGLMTNISVYNNYVTGNNSGISLNNEISSGYYAHIRIYNNVIDSYKLGDVTSITYPLPLSIANSGGGSNVNHNISIYSNTVHTGSTNNYATFQIGHGSINQLDETNLKDLYVYNNIFTTDYTGTSYAISGNNLPRSSINLVNNSYYRSSGTLRAIWDSTDFNNQTEWTFGEDATFTDPKYTDKTNKNYSLQSYSPCIDTADETLIPSFDFNGMLRPQGDGYDRGAYEFSSNHDTSYLKISYVSLESSTPSDTNINFGWENISCTVTCTNTLDNSYITIVHPDTTQITIEMTKISNSDCFYYNTTWPYFGNYSYFIWAVDTSSNTNYSDTFNFSLPPNWDINSDGKCDILDLILISNHYKKMGSPGWIREDVDNNGKVNLLDLTLVTNHISESWYN